MKHQSMLLLAIVAGTLSIAPAAAGEYNDDDQVVVTEFKGKPPFKRQVVARDGVASTAETKAETASEDDADRVQVVELRGAPPFKRQIVSVEELETAEFARLETVDEPTDTRRGPPGKPTSRR